MRYGGGVRLSDDTYFVGVPTLSTRMDLFGLLDNVGPRVSQTGQPPVH